MGFGPPGGPTGRAPSQPSSPPPARRTPTPPGGDRTLTPTIPTSPPPLDPLRSLSLVRFWIEPRPRRRQTPPPCLVPAAPSSTPRSTRSRRRSAPGAATRRCPRTSSPGAAPPSLPRLHLDGSNEPRRPLCSPTLVRAVPSSSLCPVRHGLAPGTARASCAPHLRLPARHR